MYDFSVFDKDLVQIGPSNSNILNLKIVYGTSILSSTDADNLVRAFLVMRVNFLNLAYF